MNRGDVAELQRAYHDDGAVLVERVLDERSLALAEEAFRWSLANPGPAASRPFDGNGVAPMVDRLHDHLTPGAPFRHEAFPALAVPA